MFWNSYVPIKAYCGNFFIKINRNVDLLEIIKHINQLKKELNDTKRESFETLIGRIKKPEERKRKPR